MSEENKESTVDQKKASELQISEQELDRVVGGGEVLSNIANLMHDMQKTVAQNIRA